MRLPLNTKWTVPRGDCTHCNGGGRQWDGAGSRDECWECRGTGSREIQVVCEVYRRGYATGVAEATAAASRVPRESFPVNVRVLLASRRTDEAAA